MDYNLRLDEFKILFSRLKCGVFWVDHLLLGFLWWIEEKVIDSRITNEVTQAIEDYEQIDSPVVFMVEPVYTEKPSETSTSLPEMRLTAPWYIEKVE